jgi:hypothetical protein
MHIGGLAAQTGFSVRTIRFDKQSGASYPPRSRTPAGYRIYSDHPPTAGGIGRPANWAGPRELGPSRTGGGHARGVASSQGVPLGAGHRLVRERLAALATEDPVLVRVATTRQRADRRPHADRGRFRAGPLPVK